MEKTVIVYRRPNMFSVHDNIYNTVGYYVLKKMFTDELYRTSGKLILFYPERFTNIIEQRKIIERAETVGIDSLTIVTSSVYILQTVDSEHVKVVDDKEIPEDGEFFKLSNDESGMPNDGVIVVL